MLFFVVEPSAGPTRIEVSGAIESTVNWRPMIVLVFPARSTDRTLSVCEPCESGAPGTTLPLVHGAKLMIESIEHCSSEPPSSAENVAVGLWC